MRPSSTGSSGPGGPDGPTPQVPQPVLPRFAGPCLTEVVAAVVPGRRSRPEWTPAPLAEASQVVLLVLDGLGWRQLQRHQGLAPTLAAGTGGPITSVAPSTTATALTSLSTGLAPARHGVVGYRVTVDHQVLNVLRWTLDGRDARRRVAPSTFQPHTPLAQADGDSVAVVTKGEFASTGFTAAHLGRIPIRGWYTPSGLAVQVHAALKEGTRFVYAYYDGIDRVAHVLGLEESYEAELVAVDRLVGDLLGVLPPGAALVVTADHGQVQVGQRIEVLPGAVMEGVERLSGEGRFRWLHTRPGALHQVAEAAGECFGHLAWVRTLEQMIEEGWLGGTLSPEVRRRLGDVALAPFAPLAFLDPADTGEQRLVARHGSLTEEEMLVPLLGWLPAP